MDVRTADIAHLRQDFPISRHVRQMNITERKAFAATGNLRYETVVEVAIAQIDAQSPTPYAFA